MPDHTAAISLHANKVGKNPFVVQDHPAIDSFQ